MCNLTMHKNDKIRYGFKIVAIEKKTGKRYSIAMGFCYDDHERIPDIAIQDGIGGYFYQGILDDKDGCFSKEMIGRTALYENLSDAKLLFEEMKRYFEPDNYPSSRTQKYRVAILSSSVEEDIMSGDYGGKRVVAGKKLTFFGDSTYM